MRYFKLFDDMTVANRWHLGLATGDDGSEPQLWDGLRLHPVPHLVVPVTHAGRVLDFSLTSFAVPVATSEIAAEVARIAGPDLQIVPIEIHGHPEMVALNAVRLIKCLDEASSEFMKWTKEDHRADLAGSYRQVTKLVLDADAVPPDAHFFRIKGWEIALIVSETVKHAMERVGCLGAEFIDVNPPLLD